MRKLFVSFTSLLQLVSARQVSPEDLANGLFFFGCWREHAINPGGAGETDTRESNPAYSGAHAIIRTAVLRAGVEGRVAWHNGKNRTRSPWMRLDDLLAQHGIPS